MWKSDYCCIIDSNCINFTVIKSMEVCRFRRMVRLIYTCGIIRHIRFTDQNHLKLGLELMERPFTRYNLEQSYG